MYPFCFHCGAEVCLDLGIGPKEPAVRPQPWSTRAWNTYEVTAYLVYFLAHSVKFIGIGFPEYLKRQSIENVLAAAPPEERTGQAEARGPCSRVAFSAPAYISALLDASVRN